MIKLSGLNHWEKNKRDLWGKWITMDIEGSKSTYKWVIAIELSNIVARVYQMLNMAEIHDHYMNVDIQMPETKALKDLHSRSAGVVDNILNYYSRLHRTINKPSNTYPSIYSICVERTYITTPTSKILIID